MTKILIRGARVLAAPPERVHAATTDILIDGSAIAAIGPQLDAGQASEIVDGAGRLVLPGLINCHLHTWQTPLRGLAADWSLMEYLMRMHGRVAEHFTPQDIYDGTLAGALNQIAGGTTTLGDWCHNNPTPEHTDAAVAALEASGIRALFMHGTPGAGPGIAPSPHPRDELERLLNGAFGDREGRLTLGIAIPGPMYSPLEIAEHDLRLAKDLGLIASMHHSGGPTPAVDPWPILEAKGLLGPHVNIVHGNHLDDETLARLVGAGVTFTVTPEVEMGDGHGHPITGRLRELGAAPSLGIDIEAAISGEMLTAARMALAHQRALDHAAARNGARPSAGSPRGAEALGWVTREGARALGLAGRVGALEVGMQADLVMVDAEAFNLQPANDPVATVLQAHSGNIDAVMIAGCWRKQNGGLCRDDLAELSRSVRRIAARVLRAAGLAAPAA